MFQCQALREGAPEIRRKKLGKSKHRSYSYDEDESRHHSPKSYGAKDNDATSPSSTIDRTGSNVSKGVRWSTEEDSDGEDHAPGIRSGTKSHEDEPIRVRPWAKLLPGRGPVDPICLDQLSNEDREMYLKDFLPPNPDIPKSRHQESPVASPYLGFADSPVSSNGSFEEFGHSTPTNNRDDHHSGETSDERKDTSPWPLVTA